MRTLLLTRVEPATSGYLILKPRDAVSSPSQMKSCSFGIARTDIGNARCCNRSDRSAVESLLRLIFRADTRCPFSLFPRTKWLTAKYFAAHPNETEISGPPLMDWARRSFHTPISGSDRDETLERIQGWFTPSANEK
jgi:hypothetical protein